MSITPDRQYSERKDGSARPSWTDNSGHLNDAHRTVFDKTKDIPGWQMEADSYKLFEMGYFAGDVILEIGTFGGRSAVVEILGALSAGKKLQFFGIEIDINGIKRTQHSLQQFNVEEYALLYHGNLQKFMKAFSIQPTMCFVDGDHLYEGVKRDLMSLSELLLPGVPVLCHDYLNPENDTGEYGVRRAATEWEGEGYAVFYGAFGCSGFFVTTEKCRGRRVNNMPAEEFDRKRNTLLAEYGIKTAGIPKSFMKPENISFTARHRKSLFSIPFIEKGWLYDKDVNKKSEVFAPGRYSDGTSKPKWLELFPLEGNYFCISSPKQYAHDETKYDEQYRSEAPDKRSGEGLVNLLRQKNADFGGPAIEIGCGTGHLSVGLASSGAYPEVVLTDPSPLFLDITAEKMAKAGGELSTAYFAVLKAEEIDRLPQNEFSLIALRSVLHHVSEIDKFIHDAALSLRPGGALVFQEPCMEGYVLMGAMAQFLPLVLGEKGIKLNKAQVAQLDGFVKTMQFYARRDVDKSEAEDKHLFRVDEIMKICSLNGLEAEFIPNLTYEDFSEPEQTENRQISFYAFFHDYLKYCMSFDAALMEHFNKYFRSYCSFIEELSLKANGPYMHGVFVCR